MKRFNLNRKHKNLLLSGQKYSINVPIYNEFSLIEIQRDYSKILGRNIDFFLDSKSFQKKIELTRKQSKLLNRLFSNPGYTIEAGYADFVKQSSNNWILRLDADEIINREAITFLENIDLENHHVVGFQRYQVIYESGNFKVITNELFNPENHVQWRFFNRNFGTFGKSTIHNPGFELIERKLIYAPPECAIYHLDFVVRDLAERIKKMEGYNLLGQPSNMQPIQIGNIDEKLSGPIPDSEVLEFLKKKKSQIIPVL
jgi:hypothetical protein